MANIDLKPALEDACDLVIRKAQDNCTVSKAGKGYHLRDSIVKRVYEDYGVVEAIPFYAPYVEFGTGSFARDGDGRKGWWVYVTESPRQESKGYTKIYTKEEALRIYWYLKDKGLNAHITQGQHPKPFLQPALLENVDEILDVFKANIRKQLGGK